LLDERLQSDKKLIVNPRDNANEKQHAYFESLTHAQQKRLRYLIPLDGWFAVIIYPSALEKNRAQWGEYGIKEQMTRIKTNPSDHGNLVEGLPAPTRGNWPIEIDLDACRNV